jgi:hypothetical protein
MSTKANFIYEEGFEGFEETNEPQSIFGKFTGYNAYLIIENNYIDFFKLDGEYLVIKTKNNNKIPKHFKLWGDAVIEFEWDEDGLEIVLKGGHHITKKVIKNDYPNVT